MLDAFGGRDAYPPAIVTHILAGVRGQIPESPKPGDASLSLADTRLVGGRHDAMRGAAGEAARLGYAVRVIDEPVVGEARDAGPAFARQAIEAAASDGRRPPAWWPAGKRPSA